MQRPEDEGPPPAAEPHEVQADGRGEAARAAAGPPSDEAIDAFAADLAKLARGASWAFQMEIARRVVEFFHGGDPHAFHARGRKDSSLRTLVERLGKHGVDMSVTSLHDCLGAYEVWLEHEFVRTSEHLTVAHVHAVLGLPPERQAALLRYAEERHCTVHEDREAAAIVRPGRTRRLPAFLQTARLFRLALKDPPFEGVELTRGWRPKRVERLVLDLVVIAHRFGSLAARVAKLHGISSESLGRRFLESGPWGDDEAAWAHLAAQPPERAGDVA